MKETRTMKLYYSPFSTNCRRVCSVAAHLGAKLDLSTVDLLKGEHHAPDYLRLNPNGKVPTLVDGDFTLCESNAIIQYVASKIAGQTLWPSDPRAQADVAHWQFWNASHLEQATNTFIWENVFKKVFGQGDPDPARVKDADERWNRFGGVLNNHLEGRAYVAGDGKRLTVADFSIAASVGHHAMSGLPLARFRQIQRWYASIEELPAWRHTAPPTSAAT
jgi:glutathione S-transferase